MEPAAATHRLRLLPHRLAVCRFAADHRLPAWLDRCPFYTVSRTEGELSLVVPESYAAESWRAERGLRALEVAGPLDLGLVGVLAELAGTLAAADVPIFAISTFDTDYLLVREPDLAHAREALAARGHAVE